jgi:hypothetical protein
MAGPSFILSPLSLFLSGLPVWFPASILTPDSRLLYSLMQCREGCGACCIAPSISSPIPGMPDGKPAGVRCIQLDTENRCMIFGSPERPAVCSSLKPEPEMCGESASEALHWLNVLEVATMTSGPVRHPDRA